MERDQMLGYMIQALRNLQKDNEEIEKILEEIYKLEENIKKNEARSIFYEFPN